MALRICVFDADDHSLLHFGHAESWAEVQRADVVDGQPAALFDTAVFRAWDGWLNDQTITRIDAMLSAKHSGQSVGVTFPGCIQADRTVRAQYGDSG